MTKFFVPPELNQIPITPESQDRTAVLGARVKALMTELGVEGFAIVALLGSNKAVSFSSGESAGPAFMMATAEAGLIQALLVAHTAPQGVPQ